MYPALSPDGTLAAYASDRENAGRLDLWVQAVTSRSAMRLTNNGSDNYDPSFSERRKPVSLPFGSRRRRSLYHPHNGRPANAVCQAGAPPGLLARRQVDRIPGEPDRQSRSALDAHHYHLCRALRRWRGPSLLQANLVVHGSPVWLPDSKHLLVLARRPLSTPLQDLDWWILSREGATPVPAEARRFFPQFSAFPLPGDSMSLRPDGSAVGVVFSAGAQNDANIWRVSISIADWKVQGPPERLTLGHRHRGPTRDSQSPADFHQRARKSGYLDVPARPPGSAGVGAWQTTDASSRFRYGAGAVAGRQEALLHLQPQRRSWPLDEGPWHGRRKTAAAQRARPGLQRAGVAPPGDWISNHARLKPSGPDSSGQRDPARSSMRLLFHSERLVG